MIRIFIILLITLSVAQAQTPQSKSSLTTEIGTNFPDNNAGLITPLITRNTLKDLIASYQQYADVNAQTGTTYTIQSSDYGKLVTLNNSSPVAVSIAVASGLHPFNVFVSNIGSGVVTITPTTSTINGASSLSLTNGQSAWIVSDGTNYQIFEGSGGLNVGATSVTGGTNNEIFYETGGNLGQIILGNNCFYLTNGSGVPSCSNTINGSPSLASAALVYGIAGLQSGSGAWTGTAANDAGGGTTNTYLGTGAGPQSGGAYVSNGTQGAENVALGFVSGTSVTTGTANVTIGGGSGTQITTGNRNSAIGRHAMRSNHAGSDTTAIGEFANNGNDGAFAFGIFTFTGHVDNGSGGLGTLLTVTAISGTPLLVGMHIAGAGLTAIGCEIISLGTGSGGTGTYNLDCSGNTGSESMTAALVDASQNTCVGANACYYAADPAPAASTFNMSTAIGYKAGFNMFTGTGNVAIGALSMTGDGSNGITGNNNLAMGASSCAALNTGSNNTCVGVSAGSSLTSTSDTVAIGGLAGFAATGANGTYIGMEAGSSVTTGANNIIISPGGNFQSPGITTGSNNLILGGVTGLSTSLANAIVLSDGAGNVQADYAKTNSGGWTLTGKTYLPNIGTDATKTDATVCEDTTTHQLYFGSGASGVCLGTSSMRFKHDIASLVPGLAEIMKLEPIEYKYNADHGDPNHKLYGFTAEQGDTALPELVGKDRDGKPNTFDLMGVVPVLVKALQEQESKIEQQESEIAELKARLN